ncbi:MAG: hypothetical protein ACC656_03890, partial [Candidatus Heimdallarchaeota archaeon]
TGRVNNIDNYKASRQPDSSYEDIETIMMGDETYQEFVSNYEVQYQSIIYYYNNWYVYVEGSDNDGFLWTLEMEIADYNLFVQNSWYYDTGEYYTRYPRGEEMQWQFGNQWDARYIGKHLSTPLGDVIEGYVPVSSSTTSSKNENTSPSLDLNGFELIPSLIAITFMIPVYLKRRK